MDKFCRTLDEGQVTRLYDILRLSLGRDIFGEWSTKVSLG